MAFIKFQFEKDEEEKPIEIPLDFSKIRLSKFKLPKKREKAPKEKALS